jgi:hypothetical protein
MSINTNIKLNESIVPSIPFLWYREQELTCPIEHIKYSDNTFTIVQTHILDANIYICLHSLLYYTIHKNDTDLLVIPENYVINKNFTVTINGDIPKSGPVFIHGGAFSPTGFPCFRVDLSKEMNNVLCNIVCEEFNININCVFILFNNIDGKNINDDIKKYIENNL